LPASGSASVSSSSLNLLGYEHFLAQHIGDLDGHGGDKGFHQLGRKGRYPAEGLFAHPGGHGALFGGLDLN